MEKLTKKSLHTLMIILMVLFSLYPTIVDVIGEIKGEEIMGLSTIGMYGSQKGYTLINFLLLYIIGAYLKKCGTVVQKWKTKNLIMLLLVNAFVMVLWTKINDKVGYFTERSSWEYCNPLVIFSAVLVFILFSRMNLESNKVINKMAEGAFTVFLFHLVLIPKLKIEQFVTGNVFLMLLHIVGSTIIIYLLSWIVHLLYHVIADPVFRLLQNRIKLPIIDSEN